MRRRWAAGSDSKQRHKLHPLNKTRSIIEHLSRFRFLFITGKGGVGKTTLAAILATALAQKKLRVLVAQFDAPDGLERLLGTERLTGELRPIKQEQALWAVNLNPQKALADFGRLRLKKANYIKSLLEHRATAGFLDALPGLRGLALLGRLWYYSKETLPDGALRFDVILAETAGLGHLKRLLGQPQTLLSTLPRGPLRTDLEEINRCVCQSDRCGIVVATLAEALAVRETIELYDCLKKSGHHVAAVIANGLHPSNIIDTALYENIAPIPPSQSAPQLEVLLREARLLRRRQALNHHYLERLRESIDARLIQMDLLPTMGPEHVAHLANRLS
jgi:anion-transporting  ArsA/GET3 family ATPase